MEKELKKRLFNYINDNKGKGKYIQTFATFDIEQSKVQINGNDYPVCYSWAFCIKDMVIQGRDWLEYKQFVKELKDVLQDKILRVYVHNLWYEGMSLVEVFNIPRTTIIEDKNKQHLTLVKSDVSFDTPLKDSSKIYEVYDIKNGLDYRCSYCLSDVNLEKFIANTNYPKLHDFDYDEKRLPWTELTKQELKYIKHDVLGLWEAMEVLLRAMGIKTIKDDNPLTDKSFVRREFKTSYENAKKWPEFTIESLKLDEVPERAKTVKAPTYEVNKILEDANFGGYFYASRRYRGELFNDVYDFDAKSHHPAILIEEKMPKGDFKFHNKISLEELNEKYNNENSWWCARLTFKDIKLKDSTFGFPYLKEVDKEKNMSAVNPKYFDGRLLSADEYTITTTSIDYEIIPKIYTFNKDVKVEVAITSELEYLPNWFTSIMLRYFKIKETIDKKKKQEEYLRAKTIYDSVCGIIGMKFTKYNVDSKDSYFKWIMNKNWYSYAWSVCMLAHSRKRLFDAILTDEKNCLYCALDSVKFKNYTNQLDSINENIKSKAIEKDAYVKVGKNTRYLGIWELEKVKRFISFGINKYVKETYEPIKLDEETIQYAKDNFGLKDLSKFNIEASFSGANVLDLALQFYKSGIENILIGDTFIQRRKCNEVVEQPFVVVTTEDGHKLPVCTGVLIHDVEIPYTLKLTRELED